MRNFARLSHCLFDIQSKAKEEGRKPSSRRASSSRPYRLLRDNLSEMKLIYTHWTGPASKLRARQSWVQKLGCGLREEFDITIGPEQRVLLHFAMALLAPMPKSTYSSLLPKKAGLKLNLHRKQSSLYVVQNLDPWLLQSQLVAAGWHEPAHGGASQARNNRQRDRPIWESSLWDQ